MTAVLRTDDAKTLARVPVVEHRHIVLCHVDPVTYPFAKWTDVNPPEIARKSAEAWLVESAKIPMDGAAAQNRIAPLAQAAHVESPVLVQVLLQHGHRVADLAPEYRARFDAMLDPIHHPHKPVPDSVCDEDAN
ncbi:hypothetical protein [Burkholderia contaminans]|uniref:hypothetical protein n=2 Tax=Burkholderia contaminans TaxID=488447 RepID=UPI00145334B5|nr:hypothetical protein [Burkholderia contaminans]VWC97047.1 hypothetical protein BCO18175_03787 [Burkholderia contaminans]